MRTIKFGKPIIKEEEKKAVLNVLSGDTLVHGPLSKQFETDFANYTGAPHAVSVSSCTAALHLSYFTFGIGTGDEVIVPAQTHVATVHAVELSGARPIFVDAELKTGNIDIEQIESKISERTKAISIVHFLGMPVDMGKIVEIASKYNFKVIEDCALAIGSKIGNKHVGLFGDAGCFSFYPVKHFTTAEGGMFITRHPDIANRINRQRAFGVDRTPSERNIPGFYDVNMLGFNYRMNEIQAAIGIEQLKRIKGFLVRRRENYEYLEKELKKMNEITLFQSSYGDFQSSYYCLSLLLNDSLTFKRFEIVNFLNENGVGTSIYYPKPVPDFTYYKQKYGYCENDFSVARKISYTSIAFSVGPHLNIEDMQYCIQIFKKAIVKYGKQYLPKIKSF